MNTRTQQLLSGLLLVLFFTACSRPVAYFQKSQRESFATTATAPVVAPAELATTPVVDAETPAVQPTQPNAALGQLDALVSNDKKLAGDKSVQQRLNRVKTLLASQKETVSTAPAEPQKMNFMQRMMVKKMNKRISKQLAPQHPNKPMTNTAILTTGAVVVLIGLLILLLGSSGTAGTIILLAGAIILLVGLLT